MKFSSKTFAILTIALSPNYSISEEQIDYPVDYRNWTHVKTAVITETHPLFKTFGGIHHVYANDDALRALKDQSEYPDGSIFVFDLFVAKPTDGTIVEGTRRRLDVMHKNSHKFSSTENWGYGSFRESTQQLIDQDAVENCFGCHTSQKERDFVFSNYRD